MLLNFNSFRGSPLRVADGWMAWGWVWVCGGVSHACTHAHTCMHMHKHAKHDKHGCLHVGSHLQFLYMCVCMHVCMCMHVYMCGGHLPPPYTPIHPPPSPRATWSPKHQNSISLELIKIIQFHLKILYL